MKQIRVFKNILKMTILVSLIFSFWCISGTLNSISAQGLDLEADIPDTFISNSSCGAGGEIWVCGSSQLAQAHDDFKNNCSGEDYQCGKTLKTILDVCAPQIVTSTITSKDC